MQLRHIAVPIGLCVGCTGPETFEELRDRCGLAPGERRFLEGPVSRVELAPACATALADTVGADRGIRDDPGMDWVLAGVYFVLATDFGPMGDLPPPPRSPRALWEANGGAADLHTPVGAQFLSMLRTRVDRTIVHDIGGSDARFTADSSTLWVPPAGAPNRAIYDAAAILLHETGHADAYRHEDCDSGSPCDADGEGPNGVEVMVYWSFGEHLDHASPRQHALCDALLLRIEQHCDLIEDPDSLEACDTDPVQFCGP